MSSVHPTAKFFIVIALFVAVLVASFPQVTLAQSTTQPPADQTQAAPGEATRCSSWTSYIVNFPICMLRQGGGLIGGIIVYLAAWLLALAGLLFNVLVDNTIVNFGPWYETIKTAIETVWTVFRDIANIMIIGLFTFIAISIILGLEQFGQRKMIARVLIVAVLINFSLLFTKIIIDGSNFLALQFYRAAQLQPASADAVSGANPLGPTAQKGIAGQFMKFMGVGSISDARKAIDQISERSDSGIIGLLYGLFSTTVLLGAAAVLLYGSFLLVSRALLILFLLLTSSFAFATYLIPQLSTSGVGNQYGWAAWWGALIRVSVFGPLLMALLWGTLLVAQGLATNTRGTMGNILADPGSQPSLEALFSYVIILGLLFASFKVASSFSVSISGFNFAAMIPAFGIAAGARLAAFAGRQTIGRGAMRASGAMKVASQNQTKSPLSRQLYDFGAQQANKVGQRDFNALRIPGFGSAFQQTAGVKKLDTLAGKIVKGFEGTEKARAEAFAKQAHRMNPSKDERDEIIKNTRNEVLRSNPETMARRNDAQSAVDQGNAAKERLEKERGQLSETFAKALRPLQEAAERTKERAAVEGSAEAARRAAVANDELHRTANDQKRQMNEIGKRIQDAALVAKRGNEAIRHIDGRLDEEAIRRGLRPAKFQEEAELASEIAYSRFSNVLFRAAGISKQESDRLAKMAGKGVKEHRKRKSATEAMKTLKEIADEETPKEGRPPAGHTPPVPPAPGGPARH
ncbi:MAG TPA: hypothetical protein VJH91_00675 [Candidatus Paceibacterota bacterium]